MASNSIQKLSNVAELSIGVWEENQRVFNQVQVQMNNGRRFILRGLRTTDRTQCEMAVEIIKSDNQVNLSEFEEVKPEIGTPAYKLMDAKGLLERLN